MFQVQYSKNQNKYYFLFRFTWAGELTCRENWRLGHCVRGWCVQEEARINYKKHIETYWIFFFFFIFLGQNKSSFNLLSVGVSGREAIAPVKCTQNIA